MRLVPVVFFYVSGVVAQTGANCDMPCNSYNLELKNVNDIYSQNVYHPGGQFPKPAITIQSVCQLEGNNIQTCFECSTDGQGLSNDASAITLLDAWWQTCATFGSQGVDAAYNCWLSIPSGSEQCLYLASDPDTPSDSPNTPDPNAGHIEHTTWYKALTGTLIGAVFGLLW